MDFRPSNNLINMVVNNFVSEIFNASQFMSKCIRQKHKLEIQ